MNSRFNFKTRSTQHAQGKQALQVHLGDPTDGTPIYIPLENLGATIEEKASAVQKAITDAYEERKAAFEGDKDLFGNRVKNGTFLRNLTVRDLDDGISISIKVRVQRYLDKDTGTSKAFYGGILMPRIPYLACQVVTILANRAEYGHMLKLQELNPEGDIIPLHEFCAEWGISPRTFQACWEKAEACYAQNAGRAVRSLDRLLLEFLEGDPRKALAALRGFAA